MKQVYIQMDDFPMAEKTVIVTVNSQSQEIARGEWVMVEDNIAEILKEAYGAEINDIQPEADKKEAPKKKANRKKK